MKNRKFMLIALAFVLVALLALCLVACGETANKEIRFYVDDEIYAETTFSGVAIVNMPDDPTKEGYVFDGWFLDDGWWKPLTVQALLDAPLQNNNGYNVYAKFIKYTCELDNKVHDYEITRDVPATCIQSGFIEKICNNCGYVSVKTFPALKHKYDNVVVSEAPTCTTDGVKTFTCTREGCGCFITEKIKATGHSYGAWEKVSEPSCEIAGEEVAICKTCGNQGVSFIRPLGHELDNTKHCTRQDCEYFEPYNFKVNIKSPFGNTEQTVLAEYGAKYVIKIPTNVPEHYKFKGLYDECNTLIVSGNGEYETVYKGNGADITLIAVYIYEISTIAQLNALRTDNDLISLYSNESMGRCIEFVLKNDIDISGIEWQPIGTSTKPFGSTFDGNGHSIFGLTITNVSTYMGLFGYCRSAHFANLKLENVNIELSAITTSIKLGSLVGYNNYTKNSIFSVEECVFGFYENIEVSGIMTIPAHSVSYISNVGGIVGEDTIAYMREVTNNIDIFGTNTGGLIGNAIGLVAIDCKNAGNITGARYAGGFVGLSIVCQLENGLNLGNISAVYGAGGFIGKSPSVEINCSANKGSVAISASANNNYAAGGIIGVGYDLKAENCYNIGDITTTSNGGGFIGTFVLEENTSLPTIMIKHCYNAGVIHSNATGTITSVGGFVGYSYSANILECVNHGSISSTGSATNKFTLAFCVNGSVESSYYSCSTTGIGTIQGHKTTTLYDKSFYTDIVFWQEYNSETQKGYWVFSDIELPKLWWELGA